MRTLAGLQKPLGGQVRIEGSDIDTMSSRRLARSLAVVLTERITTSMLSGYEVVALGRNPHTDWSGKLSQRDHEVIAGALEAVQAEPLASRHVNELSDGERQRIMMARALAQEPRVMILDEITAFLDLPGRVDAMRILQKVAHREGRAVLLSTHDLDLAIRSADKIWLLAKDGAVYTGSPESLVLNGALASTFQSEGVLFEPATGAFQVQREPIGDVAVIGEGLHALWTIRALERKGLRVTKSHSNGGIQVEVFAEGERVHWISRRDGDLRRCDTLENLLATVASVHPEGY
jgi:iron complex transport system ATP-binding protein